MKGCRLPLQRHGPAKALQEALPPRSHHGSFSRTTPAASSLFPPVGLSERL